MIIKGKLVERLLKIGDTRVDGLLIFNDLSSDDEKIVEVKKVRR